MMLTNTQKASQAVPYPPPTLEQRPDLPFVEFNGYRFHCRIWGKDHTHTLLVLHGGPGGDAHYLLAASQLAKYYRVVFYDQRGCGLSPRTEAAQLHLSQYLQDLDAFVSHFGQGGPVSLIGHSWGAHLALQYLARHSEKIHKVVLAEPFIPSQALSLRILLHNLQQGVIPKLIKALYESHSVPASDAHARRDYFFARVLKVSNPGYNCQDQSAEVNLLRAGFEAFIGLSFSRASRRSERKLGAIYHPPVQMLMLSGACNQLLQEKYFRRIQKKLGHPKLVQIPEAGHYLFTDNPAACNQEICNFIG